MTERQKRLREKYAKIWKLRGEGKTLEEIGRLVGGLTRQRVQQVLDKSYNTRRRKLYTTRIKSLDKKGEGG